MLGQVSDTDAPRKHFALFGFPVRIHPFFWAIALILGASGLGESWSTEVLVSMGMWVLVVFVSILWHELGHAFAMRHYGYAPWIVLHGMGGATSWGKGPPKPTPKMRVIVSLAGPFAGFALGFVFLGLYLVIDRGVHWALDDFLERMMLVNLGWGAVNLVPMIPWDGGMALHGALDHFTGGKGLKPTAYVTIAVAFAIGGLLLYFLPGEWWLLFLVGFSAFNGFRALSAAKEDAAARKAPLDPMKAIAHARASLERAGGPDALARAILLRSASDDWRRLAEGMTREVLPKIGSPAQRAMALELSAWAFLLAGDAERADATASRMRPSHDPSAILAALIAARRDRPQEALDAAADMHEEEADAARMITLYARTLLGGADAVVTDLTDDEAELGSLLDAAVFHAEAFEQAAALGEALFERFGESNDAYNTACSLTRAGRPDEALRWIERAIDAGYDDLAHLETDEDLADARARPGYPELAERLRS